MSKLRVEGFSGLVRDTNSNAIVNVNKSEYQLYMSRYKSREKQSDVLRDTVKEINTLKPVSYTHLTLPTILLV